MVIGHYYYGKLLSKIISYVEDNNRRYFHSDPDQLEIRSWIDKFLFSDVYVLGFGYDYAEMDLWWLLNQKKREQLPGMPKTKVYFYEPAGDDKEIKHKLLECYDVEVWTLGVKTYAAALAKVDGRLWEENKKMYEEFYYKALEDMVYRIKLL